MKQVNVRFIVSMLVVAVVIGAIGYAVHAYQTKRHAGFFLERAKQAQQLGDLPEALKELNHYLRLVPDDHAARIRKGLLLAEARQDYDAFTVLEKALRQADDETARRTLVDVLLRMRRWQDAREHLEQNLLPAAPNDPVLLDRLAQCQWAEDEFDAARQSLEQAIEADPQQIESYRRLIALLESQPDLTADNDAESRDDATTWQQRMVEANPNAVMVYVTRADDQVKQAMATMRSDSPSTDQLTAARADLQAALQDAEQARSLLAQCRQPLDAMLETVQQEQSLGDATEQLSTIRQHLRSLEQVEQTIDRLVSMVQAEAEAEAERVLEQLANLDRIVTALESETWWITGSCHWGLAGRQPTIASTEEEGDDDDAQPATTAQLDAEQVEQARQAAQTGLDLQPQDARLYGLLAEIDLATGDRAAAKQKLQQGVDTVEARTNLPLSLIRLQLEDGELDAARQVISTMREREFPESVVDYYTGRIEYTDGNWTDAVRRLNSASSQVADEPDLAKRIEYWLGRAYQQQQKAEEEIRAYRRALVIDPQYRPARLMLADALRRSGQWDQALEQYRSGLPGTPNSQLLIAQVELQRQRSMPPSQRNWETLESLLDELDQSLPDSTDVVLLRADVLVAQQQMEQAETMLRQAIQRLPDRVSLRCALAQLLIQDEQQPRIEEAAQLLDTAEQELGDSVSIRLMRGALLVRQDAEQSVPQLRQLAENVDEFSPRRSIATVAAAGSAVVGQRRSGAGRTADSPRGRTGASRPGHLAAAVGGGAGTRGFYRRRPGVGSRSHASKASGRADLDVLPGGNIGRSSRRDGQFGFRGAGPGLHRQDIGRASELVARVVIGRGVGRSTRRSSDGHPAVSAADRAGQRHDAGAA
jgi:tetratricopeptide (TPR) repeat protein